MSINGNMLKINKHLTTYSVGCIDFETWIKSIGHIEENKKNILKCDKINSICIVYSIFETFKSLF